MSGVLAECLKTAITEQELEILELKTSLRMAADRIHELERYKFDIQYAVETNRYQIDPDLLALLKRGL